MKSHMLFGCCLLFSEVSGQNSLCLIPQPRVLVHLQGGGGGN